MSGKLSMPLKSGSFSHDFLASIVAFLVALPLCLGIAIASGAPPMLGLVTGIIGGIIVGSISGSPLQVSGPAAGLVALVYEIITGHGLATLGIVVLMAGLIQVVAGYFKLGQWFRAISPAVIQGMLAGIGVLIVASQFHVMLDVIPESNALANITSIPETIRKGLFPMDNASHHWAAMIGVISLGVILFWNTLPARFKLVPPALVAVILAVAISVIMQLPIKYVTVPGQLTDILTFPTMESLALLANSEIWVMIATIAVVASAETMLSASAVDQMHDGVRTKYDKEMLAQGVGNTLCGLVGALPMTGVIVRSSANIHAGAKTRISAILHGAWLLGLVSFFPFVLEMIPTAALAAILVYTGYKLVNVAAIKKLWRYGGRSEVAIYLVTVTMVVSTNLLEGVIAGSILAVLKLLYTLTHLRGYTVPGDNNRAELYLKGSATFLSLPRLVAILERQPQGKDLHVHVENLAHLDHSCLEALQSWEQQYTAAGGSISMEWHSLTDKVNAWRLQETPAASPAVAKSN